MKKILTAALMLLAGFTAINAGTPGTPAQQPTETAASSTSRRTSADVIDNPQKWRFAWNADIGASIDMCGKDMSSIDFNVSLGTSYKWINFLGIGLGADFMVSNSCRSYPLFLQFRTNFSSRPSIVFWDVRGGVSLNYIEHNHQQTGAYASTGIGFYLARSRKFSSHLMLSYTLLDRRRYVGEEMTNNFHDIHYASVKIGVAF